MSTQIFCVNIRIEEYGSTQSSRCSTVWDKHLEKITYSETMYS